ncbi:triacylglycerol lipase II [Fusarium heterosporum]|uniref:Carboxylic ester hydrolase n=1 Tax=Fusarium heterosporum TaxID=42747 RepID=A0A8H5TEI2_FUSHE|nr:triacylglycerol lipase II [Fusarium heterosporum]
MRFLSNFSLVNAGRALVGLPQAVLSLSPEAGSAPIVTVRNGTYAGVYNSQYNQDYFLGVPFAQPPERFSVAQGLNASWEGVRQATKYSVHCYGYGYDQDGFEQSEDCLYLNIVRPAGLEDTSTLPVTAWIHGGGLVMGGAPDPRYNLSFIVEQSVALGTPVIGISLNYRLSAFGFPAGKEALKEGVTNLGFRDQRLALRWINENIAAFGGDPGKVTIFGESSGAESVGAQILAYNGHNDGLFRGAIAESGFGAPFNRFPDGFNATESIQANYDTLVKAIPSCSDLIGTQESLACLRKAPFEEVHGALTISQGMTWIPILDGDFFADYPTNQFNKGCFAKVPILIGANTDEGTSFSSGRTPDGGVINTDEQMREAIGTVIPAQAEKNTGKTHSELVDELMELYPNDQSLGIPSLESWPHIIKPGDSYAEKLGLQYRRANAVFGDYLMQYQRRRANKAWDNHGIPSYVYRFNIQPNGQPPNAGVTHFQEVAFVFNNIRGDGYTKNPFGGEGAYPADAKAMAKTISSAWINFFTTLDPNGDSGSEIFGGKEWPVYELSDGPDGKGVVFNINGTHVEVDDWRSEGMAWMAKHALPVFGN